MKRFLFCALAASLILAGAAAVVAGAAQERMTFSGYLPPLEGHDWSQGPSYILCPEPRVEMVEDGTGDGFYDEAWNCAPTDYTCFHTAGRDGGYGCSGGGIPGWEVPATASAQDFRDEIMEHVVKPCYTDMAQRNAVPGFSDEALVDLAMMVNPQSVENMIDGVLVMLNASPQQDWPSRKLVYALSLNTCINAARSGG